MAYDLEEQESIDQQKAWWISGHFDHRRRLRGSLPRLCRLETAGSGTSAIRPHRRPAPRSCRTRSIRTIRRT